MAHVEVAKTLRRERALRAYESTQPLRLFYVSFAKSESKGGFQGAVIVKARGTATAIDRVNELGINPGGSILVDRFPGPVFPELMDRLLSREELQAAFGELEKVPDNVGDRVCEHCNEIHGPEKTH